MAIVYVEEAARFDETGSEPGPGDSAGPETVSVLIGRIARGAVGSPGPASLDVFPVAQIILEISVAPGIAIARARRAVHGAAVCVSANAWIRLIASPHGYIDKAPPARTAGAAAPRAPVAEGERLKVE